MQYYRLYILIYFENVLAECTTKCKFDFYRQYGQIINSPMAVVIQEMVNCDVAGVLFTCDPLTGNPTYMSITANYGLGEVSLLMC